MARRVSYAIKVTYMKIQHSSFTSGALAPYFGCLAVIDNFTEI